jgi:hypothetical protein
MATSGNLPFHEWLIVVLIVALMLTLTVVTWVWEDSSLPATSGEHILYSNKIKVSVLGAVEKPGSYTLKKGDTLRDLLLLAQPLPHADMSKLKSSARLKNKQEILVPSHAVITVYVEGAVLYPGPVQVLKETKLSDLGAHVQLLPHADLSVLKKKRRLKNDELIYIPNR